MPRRHCHLRRDSSDIWILTCWRPPQRPILLLRALGRALTGWLLQARSYRRARTLEFSFRQHLLRLGDGQSRIQAFRTGLRAVHYRVTAIKPEWIFEFIEPLAGRLVTRVDEP